MAETLYKGKFLKLLKQGNWEYVERTNAKAVVVILPVTADNKLVMVEQHRIPLGKNCLELPAGLAGDVPPTDFMPCQECDELANSFCEFHLGEEARRELLEETGYKAGSVKLISKGPSSCGMTSELVNLFFAKDLTKVHEGGGDETENITVHEVELPDVHDFLETKAKEGKVIDPKIYTGLYFLIRAGY